MKSSIISTTANAISSGGTISGDLTINGDLTVNGDGSGNYDEIINGNLEIVQGDAKAELTLLSSSNTHYPRIHLKKADLSDNLVDDDDLIGNITWHGYDGDQYLEMAMISAVINGTAANNQMPGSLEFKVNAGGTGVNADPSMVIDSSGEVGIGTDSPGDVLHIVSASDGGATEVIIDNSAAGDSTDELVGFRFRHNGGTASRILVGREENFSGGTTRSGFLSFRTSKDDTEAEQMRISSAGEVGIGTSTFNNERLHIHRASSSGSFMRFSNTDSSTGASDGIVIGQDNSENCQIWNNENASVYFGTNGTLRMTIDSSGNIESKVASASHSVNLDTYSTTVGHGASLDIRHSNHASNTVETDDDTVLGTINFKGVDNGSNFDTGAGIQVIQNGSAGTKVPCDMSIFVSSSSATNTVMTLTKDATVGVGSDAATPLGKLHVASADSGSGAHADADELVVEGSTSAGISIISDHDATAKIIFGCAEDTQAARITNTQSTGVFTIGACQTNGVTKIEAGSGNVRMVIDDNSRISLSNNDGNTSNTVFGKSAFNDGGSDVGADYNVAIGELAMGTGTIAAAQNNTAIGYRALTDITGNGGGGDDNVAIGYDAATNLTTGRSSVAIGKDSLKTATTTNYCVTIGESAGTAINHADAAGTVAIGYNAGVAITEGQYSTFVGYQSGKATVAANHNTAFGYNTLLACTGECNTVVGSHAGDALINNSHNTVMGYNALSAADSGETNNVVIGSGAGSAIDASGCDDNIIIGFDAGVGNIDQCVAIGFEALQSTGTEDVADSRGAIAIGYQALTALTTGSSNTAVGYQTLSETTTGSNNTAIGYNAMYRDNAAANTNNTFIGANSGNGDWSGDPSTSNTGVGSGVMQGVMNGATNNTAVGLDGLQALTTGDNNAAFGRTSLGGVLGGVQNTGLGAFAGDTVTTGSNNVCIGYQSDVSASGASNQIAIGQGTTGTGDNEIALGNTSVSAIKAQVTSITAYSSDERTKKDVADYDLKGVDFINELNLKTYIYKNPADFPDEIRDSKWDEDGVEKPKDPTETQVGLIAQEVEAALAKHGVGNTETYAPTQDSGIKTLTYGNLIFPLIKAVQELSAKVEELEKK